MRFRAWRRSWRGRGRHRGSLARDRCACRLVCSGISGLSSTINNSGLLALRRPSRRSRVTKPVVSVMVAFEAEVVNDEVPRPSTPPNVLRRHV
jgi:hypothetical protein